MEFNEAWSTLGGELKHHPDAPDLFRLADVQSACEVFYEIGKLAGIDRHNLLVDAAVHDAIAEVRAKFSAKS